MRGWVLACGALLALLASARGEVPPRPSAPEGSTVAAAPSAPFQRLTGWEYRFDPPSTRVPGQAPTWNDPAGWRPMGHPPLPHPGHPDAWFRIPLPAGTWRDPAVFLSGVDTDPSAFVDGVQVLGRDPDATRFGITPLRWFLFGVPQNAPGKTLLLEVHSAEAPHIGPYGAARMGDRATLTSELITMELPHALVGVAFLAFAVIALMTYFRSASESLYLSFALFCFAEAAVMLSVAGVTQLVFPHPVALHLLLFVGRACAPVGLVAFAASVVGGGKRAWIARGIRWLGTGVLAVVVASLWSRVAFAAATVLLNLEFALSVLALTGVLLEALRRRRPGAGSLLLGLMPVVGTAALEWQIAPGSTWTHEATVWSRLVLGVAMGNLALVRFSRVFHEVRLRAQELEQRNTQLAAVEARLQQEVRVRDEFLSIASHELRNPLAVIATNTHLLARDGSVRGEARNQVGAVQRQVGHLTRLVDDLLDVSRLTHQKLNLRRQPLLLAKALVNAVQSLRSIATERGVHLLLVSPPVPLWVDADVTRLDQVLSNLIRNALKYTPSGGHVRVELEQDGAHAVIRVRDDGVGIEPQTLSRLFTLFQQGQLPGAVHTPVDATAGEARSAPGLKDGPRDGLPDRARDGLGEGLGVGLALVRRLVELHQGTVTAHSEGPGKGSEFAVRLPLGAPPPESVEPAPAPPPVEPPPVGEGVRVLLVDDNANLRLSMRLALQLGGFRVAEAADGKRGVEQLLAGTFDAAVIDLRMPELDGCEVARQVRGAGSPVRLIALTGHGFQQDVARAREAGFEQVLVKPIDPDRLMEILADRAGPSAVS